MRRLEDQFGDQLLVIGVHSAKYTAEGKDVHLKQAVRRMGLDHPVVNDREMRIWSSYTVRAWPTLMFIGPDVQVIGKHEGEFDVASMASVVEQVLDEARDDLRSAPIDWLDVLEPPQGELAYPTAIQALDGRLAIADMRKHQILVTDADGRIEASIGSGQPGFADGSLSEAQFNAPHGLAVTDDGRIIVADTENHSIRSIDLEAERVSTIAGTGEIAHGYESGGTVESTSLRSPWDVALDGDDLYIGMAGSHQLWYHRLGSDQIRRYAGTGHEGKRDGTLRNSWLAQSSGVSVGSGELFFCDAETSSVRRADLRAASDGQVETLVGKDLFDWGDVDGALDAALLQHTTSVVSDPERDCLYVSDTYNNKIKRIDLERGTIETFAGTGKPGHRDGQADQAQLFEPHGLALVDDTLIVADTNNHAIRRIDLDSGEVSTIDVHVESESSRR